MSKEGGMSKLDRLDHTAQSEEAANAIIEKGLKIGRWVKVGDREYEIVGMDMNTFHVKLRNAEGGEMDLKAVNMPEAYVEEK
ncbi:MAG: hypothetical protein ABH835_00355 [Patescibacteria group bacterium]|nr:hypothetical protein [Patescibacteria group bacterium]